MRVDPNGNWDWDVFWKIAIATVAVAVITVAIIATGGAGAVVLGAAIGAGMNLGSQLLAGGEIDFIQVLVSAAMGAAFALPGVGFFAGAIIGATGSAATSFLQGNSGKEILKDAFIGGIVGGIGAGVGKYVRNLKMDTLSRNKQLNVIAEAGVKTGKSGVNRALIDSKGFQGAIRQIAGAKGLIDVGNKVAPYSRQIAGVTRGILDFILNRF